MSLISVFDIDGCLAEIGGKDPMPHRPVRELAEFLRRHPARRAVITGQPLSVARHIPDFTGVDFAFICPDYGSGIFTPDGRLVATTIPPEQVRALNQAREVFTSIVTECFDGVLDGDRGAIFSVNFFWHSEGAFRAAQRAMMSMDNIAQIIRPGGQPLLRIQWNASDWSMNVLPASACKGNAIRWLQQEDDIDVGAGDSGSDLPMLREARYPIATHGGGGVKPELRAVVNGHGFVAPDDRPHGFGLLDGLLHQQRLLAA